MFNPGADDQLQLAFEMELRTYFGLTGDQIEEFKGNWLRIYDVHQGNFLRKSIPPFGTLHTETAIGYWQWGYAYITKYISKE